MKRAILFLAAGASIAVAGCHSASCSMPATEPTTMPAAAATMPPLKDMTHSFTKDTPYFISKPATGATPDGVFKAGIKVIVLIPGAPYCQVLSQDGVTAYASIEDLEPLSTK